MKKISLVLALFATLGCTLSAAPQLKKEKVDSIAVEGNVFDRYSSHHLVNTTIEMLRADSTLISAARGGSYFYQDKTDGRMYLDSISNFEINIPKVEGKYLIRVSKEGYEIEYAPFEAKINRRDTKLNAGKIFLTPVRVRTLGEFTVKASRVMFYNKGDTIVYNADAFNLPEGSMLDVLIRQLPGVTMDGSRIYVNGRYVETLILNGKDFFKGKNEVMLDNLGAYAVKDIAVYEKKDDMSGILGEREDVGREYVMDVRLKKDYMTGHIVNAQLGGGTKSRYIGRLFGMRYTTNSRVALYGNANNINKERLTESFVSEDGMPEQSEGLQKRINGGVDYLADNMAHTWEVSGNVDAGYVDDRNHIVTNSVNYLQSVDNFSFSDASGRNKDFGLSTAHRFRVLQDKWNLSVRPEFSYNKNKKNDATEAATFKEEIQNLNKQILESLYSGDRQELLKALVNRSITIYESDSHGWKGNLAAESKIRIPGSPDSFELKASTVYDRRSFFGNTLQNICFGSLITDGGAVPESSLLQQRFQSDRPQYSFKAQGLARYYFNIPFGSLNASYEYIHTQTRKNSDMSLLEAVTDNGMAEFIPGMLPVPDLANSYTSKLYKNQHILKVMWGVKKKFSNGTLQLGVEPKLFIERHDLFYHRGDVDAYPHRSFTRFNIENGKISWNSKNNKFGVRLSYSMTQTAPNLINMIDVVNTSDPLNIWTGNPNLKKSTKHLLTLNLNLRSGSRFSHGIYSMFRTVDNDIVQGYSYDSETGVRYYKSYNVSGNYSCKLNYWLDFRFGKDDEFRLRNTIYTHYDKYSNMIGYDSSPVLQHVKNKGISDFISLTWNKNAYYIQIDGSYVFDHSKAGKWSMTKNNSGSWKIGLIGRVDLPFNFDISTHLDLYRRFGFVEHSMNSADLLWAAQLGYSIKKGVCRITLDAYDILNQFKGINYEVNAMGRTQTVSSVLPRYLMLSVHYKFDFKPKRNN